MKLAFRYVRTDVDVATEAIGLDAVQCGEAAYNMHLTAGGGALTRYVAAYKLFDGCANGDY